MAYECFEGSLRRSSGIFCPLPCSRIFTVLASSSIVCLRGLLALRLSLLVDWVSLICALGFWFMWLYSPLRPFVDFEAPSVQFIWWLSLLVDWVSPICALGLWFLCSGALVFVASPPPLRPFVHFEAPSVQFTWCSAPYPWILANWWNSVSRS